MITDFVSSGTKKKSGHMMGPFVCVVPCDWSLKCYADPYWSIVLTFPWCRNVTMIAIGCCLTFLISEVNVTSIWFDW